MKEYTKKAVMDVMAQLVVEQAKLLQKDSKGEDLKFEIFGGSADLLGYGLRDGTEAFIFAEAFLENYKSIEAEIWKDENASYGEDQLNKKIEELVLKTKA